MGTPRQAIRSIVKLFRLLLAMPLYWLASLLLAAGDLIAGKEASDAIKRETVSNVIYDLTKRASPD